MSLLYKVVINALIKNTPGANDNFEKGLGSTGLYRRLQAIDQKRSWPDDEAGRRFL